MVQGPFCPYISHVQCHTSQTNKNVYIITHTLVIYHTHHMHGLSHYRWDDDGIVSDIKTKIEYIIRTIITRLKFRNVPLKSHFVKYLKWLFDLLLCCNSLIINIQTVSLLHLSLSPIVKIVMHFRWCME